MITALQRQLIYFPQRSGEAELIEQAGQIGLIPWRGAQGELIGWTGAEPKPGAQRMVVFHGNAGFAANRVYFQRGFESLDPDPGWKVFLFEYPGFGAREGKPSERVIMAAAAEALDLLYAQQPQSVYLTGESLGSGVACQLAASTPKRVAGLFLVTPFTRLADVASYHYPWLPVRWLLRERYDCAEALSHYRGPVAFLLAGRDEVVPTTLGSALEQGYQGSSALLIDENAGHNSLDYQPGLSWWREVSEFLLEK